MKQKRGWKRWRGGREKLGTWGALLCLFLVALSSTGCALFQRRPVGVGSEPCPTMTDRAIVSWGDMFFKAHPDLRVWHAEMIVHCEKIEARLE